MLDQPGAEINDGSPALHLSSQKILCWSPRRFPCILEGTEHAMKMPFPGMDPYLEHPVLWESVHTRLIVTLAEQLQPRLDPRYVTSVEERVFIEGPQRRIPDLWVQKTPELTGPQGVLPASPGAAVVVEIEDLEVRESRIEILDAYNSLKLVALIELVSPTNKAPGPGRESYLAKQAEILARDCHLVEIDLHRQGRHVMSIPGWRAERLPLHDYLACVSRWPQRKRFELYYWKLRDRLPEIRIPLAEPDPDVLLDLQAGLEHVYHAGRYAKRVRYGEPCDPPLSPEDQQWASKRITAFLATGGTAGL
jgi:hypothetical protein